MTTKRTFEQWFASRGATRKDWSNGPSAFLWDDAETNLRKIEANAKQWLKILCLPHPARHRMADIRRTALVALELCHIMAEPPPAALIEVIGRLMNVKKKQATIKNASKFNAATIYVAHNPSATVYAIHKALGGYDKRQIGKWLKEPLFQTRVRSLRHE